MTQITSEAQYKWAVNRVEELPTLVDVLKLRMYEMGLTQKALAEKLGVTPSRVSEYLSGKCEPTLHVARTISTQLNINPAIVLGV